MAPRLVASGGIFRLFVAAFSGCRRPESLSLFDREACPLVGFTLRLGLPLELLRPLPGCRFGNALLFGLELSLAGPLFFPRLLDRAHAGGTFDGAQPRAGSGLTHEWLSRGHGAHFRWGASLLLGSLAQIRLGRAPGPDRRCPAPDLDGHRLGAAAREALLDLARADRPLQQS